jgi:hypothetical protein
MGVLGGGGGGVKPNYCYIKMTTFLILYYTSKSNGGFVLFFFLNIFLGDFLIFSYYIQNCFICRPSDSTVPTEAGIEPRTVATGALAVRRSNH